MREDYLDVLLCLALSPLLYLQTWGRLLIDESLQRGRHSERQLEQPQCFKPGLMGHMCVQHQGTASSSCPHICWVNEGILPKTRTLTDHRGAGERCVDVDVCDHTSSGVCAHTPKSLLQEGEDILSIVEGLLWLCLIPPPLSAAEFSDWFATLEGGVRGVFELFLSKQKGKRCIHLWKRQFIIILKMQMGLKLFISWFKKKQKSKPL